MQTDEFGSTRYIHIHTEDINKKEKYSGLNNIDTAVIDDPVNEGDSPTLALQVLCEGYESHFKECALSALSPKTVCAFAAVSCGQTSSEASVLLISSFNCFLKQKYTLQIKC